MQAGLISKLWKKASCWKNGTSIYRLITNLNTAEPGDEPGFFFSISPPLRRTLQRLEGAEQYPSGTGTGIFHHIETTVGTGISGNLAAEKLTGSHPCPLPAL